MLFLAIARCLELFSDAAAAAPEAWMRVTQLGFLPAAGITGLAAFATFRFNYESPTCNRWAGPRARRSIAKKIRVTWIRAVALLLLSAAAIAVPAWLRDVNWSDVVTGSLLHAALLAAGAYGLARFVTRLTDWPFSATIMRAAWAILVVCIAAALLARYPKLVGEYWDTFIGDAAVANAKGFGTATLSLLVACASCVLANWNFPPLAAAAFQAGSDRAHPLNQLLYRSLYEKVAISITLVNGKEYIGWVTSQPPAIDVADGYFTLLPARSGYRHTDSKELVLTTHYEQIYRELTEDAIARHVDVPEFAEFQKVIPLANVVTAGIFDAEAYRRFELAPRQPRGTAPALGENAAAADRSG